MIVLGFIKNDMYDSGWILKMRTPLLVRVLSVQSYSYRTRIVPYIFHTCECVHVPLSSIFSTFNLSTVSLFTQDVVQQELEQLCKVLGSLSDECRTLMTFFPQLWDAIINKLVSGWTYLPKFSYLNYTHDQSVRYYLIMVSFLVSGSQHCLCPDWTVYIK